MRKLLLVVPLLILSAVTIAQVQLPKKLPRIPVDKIPGLSRVPGLDKILGKEPPITTSLTDAVTEVPFLDDFDPDFPMSLGHAQRDNQGIYTLGPGTYRYSAQSYCLKAGTHSPSRGKGYIYAPLKGPKANIVRSILQRSIEHSDIPQKDIQVLLWAIIARAKLKDMPVDYLKTANRLLTPKELYELNGGALGLIPEDVKQRALANLPESVKKIIEAENKIRQLATTTNARFEDFERVAVLLGDPPVEPGDRTDLPEKRWSYHPAGYFVRFEPHGFSVTDVEVSVPDWYEIVRDDSGRITRISDRHGHRIETSYEPAAKKPDPSAARASSFASVRLISTAGLSEAIVAKWERTGWLLTGLPAEGSAVAGETLKITDVAQRAANARRRQAEFQHLLTSIKRRSAKTTDPSATVRELVDLASFYDGLRALAGARAEKEPRLGAYLDLPVGAWRATFARAASSTSGSPARQGQPRGSGGRSGGGSGASAGDSSSGMNGGTDFDPSENVGTPGATGSQRLGQSSRSSKECGCDRDDLCKDLAAARNAASDPGTAAANLADALKELKKHFCDNPAAEAQIDQMISSLRYFRPQIITEIRWDLNEMMDQSRCARPPECPITTSTTMMCPHGGRVQGIPGSGSGATAGGSVILGAQDQFVVVGCPFIGPGGRPSPCIRVMWVGGTYPELSCNSTAIVTNAEGVPQGPVIVNPQPF